jgi:hypothetical protein
MRCLPASLLESPNTDVYIARNNNDTVGSVTLTYHGDSHIFALVMGVSLDSNRHSPIHSTVNSV